ncbi:MAG: hypothetical protein O3C21_00385 [Verrucomicrobia bacterium]|nr:hypothetical protein [Verrucomicrobiota bacterium]
MASIACDRPRPPSPVQENTTEPLQIDQLLLENSSGVLELPFSEVIEKVSGKRIIPIDASDAVTALFPDNVSVAADVAIVQIECGR